MAQTTFGLDPPGGKEEGKGGLSCLVACFLLKRHSGENFLQRVHCSVSVWCWPKLCLDARVAFLSSFVFFSFSFSFVWCYFFVLACVRAS